MLEPELRQAPARRSKHDHETTSTVIRKALREYLKVACLPPRLPPYRLHELPDQDLKVGSTVRKPSRSPRQQRLAGRGTAVDYGC
jgi:hypothetical protein